MNFLITNKICPDVTFEHACLANEIVFKTGRTTEETSKVFNQVVRLLGNIYIELIENNPALSDIDFLEKIIKVGGGKPLKRFKKIKQRGGMRELRMITKDEIACHALVIYTFCSFFGVGVLALNASGIEIIDSIIYVFNRVTGRDALCAVNPKAATSYLDWGASYLSDLTGTEQDCMERLIRSGRATKKLMTWIGTTVFGGGLLTYFSGVGNLATKKFMPLYIGIYNFYARHFFDNLAIMQMPEFLTGSSDSFTNDELNRLSLLGTQQEVGLITYNEMPERRQLMLLENGPSEVNRVSSYEQNAHDAILEQCETIAEYGTCSRAMPYGSQGVRRMRRLEGPEVLPRGSFFPNTQGGYKKHKTKKNKKHNRLIKSKKIKKSRKSGAK